MKIALRGIGALMLVYAGVYLAQYLFSALYDNPQRVWDVMNIISAVGILAALALNLAHLRRQTSSGGSTSALVGAHLLFYANAALAIWYFHNWIRLLTLEAGEVVIVPHEVIWQLIGVMVPLVLATTGWRLWQNGIHNRTT